LFHFLHFYNSLIAIAIAALAAQNKETNDRKLQNTSSNVSRYEFREFQPKKKLDFFVKISQSVLDERLVFWIEGKLGNFGWYTLIKTTS